jgi:uncharacterized membrane protein
MVMGPLTAFIVAALEGAAVGGTAGVVGAALVSLGIPENSIVKYESDLKAGKFLVLVQGSQETILRARAILATTPATEITTHT